MNIGAIIVTYNPLLDILAENISTYNTYVARLIIVDNSDYASI